MLKLSKVFDIRAQSSLPFYCNPLKLFIFTWLVMLVGFQFHISYVSYPHFSLALFLFVFSLFSFLAGHYFARLLCTVLARRSPEWTHYQIDINKLRHFIFYLACAASALSLLNLITSGLPPFLGFFGFKTEDYAEYGRLKQIIFPLLMAVFVNSSLETSRSRKVFYSLFAFFGMLCYVARGDMMLMLFQALIVYSVQTASKVKIYLVAVLGLIGAAILVDVIGSNRTGDLIFFTYMQIKTEFQQWPTLYLWIISYVSTPLSNLCWLVDLNHFDHVTWSFSYPMLPSFWAPVSPHENFGATSKIIDGVHTYLATYFLDFSYFGIILINLCIGMASGYYSSARRVSRKLLSASVFLSCIAFMFFFDFFVYLQIVILVGIQTTAQRYFMKEFQPRPSGSSAQLAAGKP